MSKIHELLSNDTNVKLWAMHYDTPEYNAQGTIYSYQFSAILNTVYDSHKLKEDTQDLLESKGLEVVRLRKKVQ
jgi:hypothetical protein